MAHSLLQSEDVIFGLGVEEVQWMEDVKSVVRVGSLYSICFKELTVKYPGLSMMGYILTVAATANSTMMPNILLINPSDESLALSGGFLLRQLF